MVSQVNSEPPGKPGIAMFFFDQSNQKRPMLAPGMLKNDRTWDRCVLAGRRWLGRLRFLVERFALPGGGTEWLGGLGRVPFLRAPISFQGQDGFNRKPRRKPRFVESPDFFDIIYPHGQKKKSGWKVREEEKKEEKRSCVQSCWSPVRVSSRNPPSPNQAFQGDPVEEQTGASHPPFTSPPPPHPPAPSHKKHTHTRATHTNPRARETAKSRETWKLWRRLSTGTCLVAGAHQHQGAVGQTAHKRGQGLRATRAWVQMKPPDRRF